MRVRTLRVPGKKIEYLTNVSVTTVHPNGKHNYISTSWHTHTHRITAEFPSEQNSSELRLSRWRRSFGSSKSSMVDQLQRKPRMVYLTENGQDST